LILSPIDEINLFQYLHKEKEYLRKKKNLLGEKERKKRNNGAGETAGLKCQQDSPAGIARCLLCVYSLLSHTLLCAPQRRLNVIKDRERKNISISIFFFFCVFIYLEMIVPGTAGGQGPLGSPGGRRLVSVLCCMGAPVTLWHIQVSAAERLCDVGKKKKKGQTRAPTK
jgi:hypothetical protein